MNLSIIINTIWGQNQKPKRSYRTVLILLVAMFSLFSYLPVSAQSNGINLNLKNATVEQILNEIESKTTYRFLYNKQLVDVSRKVTISAEKQEINQVLSQLFGGTGVAFNINGKQIVLSKSTTTSSKKVAGTILDEKGEPVIGATVKVKGANSGTISDIDGKFSIDATDESVLIFSYVGYETKELTVGTKKNINVSLSQGSKNLDEVVVVGYGTTTRRKLATAITTIKLDDIDKGASNNAIQAIQGKTPGVQISNSSGIPGSTPRVLVRGINSFSGASSPLYVVDGIPLESFPSINHNDIESMDILKDASSSAIYGSRANNGVVIITTKQGKKGKTKVEFNTRYGYGGVSKDIKMANSDQYADVMQTAVDNYNKQVNPAPKIIFDRPSTIEETDWVGLITRKQSLNYENNISVSGGDDKTAFFASLGNSTQEGYIKTSLYKQYNFRTNLSHKISEMFKISINLGLNSGFKQLVEQEGSGLKVLRTAREEQPWYGPYEPNGDYSINGNSGTNLLVRHNPVMLLNEENWTNSGLAGIGGLNLEFTPFKGFKYTASVNGHGYKSNEIKKITEKHAARVAQWGALEQKRDENYRYSITNTASYSNNFSDFNYNILAGHEYYYREVSEFGASSDKYPLFPSSGFNLLNAGTNIFPSVIKYEAYNLESYFTRLSFDYKGKYFMNASLRRDASSKLTREFRNGYFPAVSFAWKVFDESFFPKRGVISDLKLKASWGETGTIDPIEPFDTFSLVSSSGKGYNSAPGFTLTTDSRRLRWEKSRQFNAGFDIDLFKGDLNFSGEYYVKQSDNLLYKRPFQSTSGFSELIDNAGSVINNGLELAVNAKILKGDVKWNIGANITFAKNRMKSLYPGARDVSIIPAAGGSSLYGGILHAFILDQPVSTWYLYNMIGIYQKDSEVLGYTQTGPIDPNSPYGKGVRAGDVKYEDVNGDGYITEADRINAGKAIPDYFGGITSNVSWKGFDLSIVGRFSVGGKIFATWKGANGTEGTENAAMSTNERGTGEQYFNVSEHYALNYWRGEGTSNTLPRPLRAKAHELPIYNSLSSTRYLEDASFFRIQTITLSYNLPNSLLSKIKIGSAKVFATADNLLTFTKYSGYDPEASFSGGPANSNYGVDWGMEPTLRVISVGANIKF